MDNNFTPLGNIFSSFLAYLDTHKHTVIEGSQALHQSKNQDNRQSTNIHLLIHFGGGFIMTGTVSELYCIEFRLYVPTTLKRDRFIFCDLWWYFDVAGSCQVCCLWFYFLSVPQRYIIKIVHSSVISFE